MNQVRVDRVTAGITAFAEGVVTGREWARRASQVVRGWAEENPGLALLAAAGAGFVLGKVLFRRRPALDAAGR
jgi:hypothetical protein